MFNQPKEKRKKKNYIVKNQHIYIYINSSLVFAHLECFDSILVLKNLEKKI